MTRRNNGNRVAPVRRTDRPNRRRMANLRGDLAVGARLAKRNGQQRRPHRLLKRGTGEIQVQIETAPRARKIFFKLPSRAHKDRIVRGFAHGAQTHAVRFVVFPEDCRQSRAVRDQLQLADR